MEIKVKNRMKKDLKNKTELKMEIKIKNRMKKDIKNKTELKMEIKIKNRMKKINKKGVKKQQQKNNSIENKIRD